jgi:hypothetical protein
MRPVLIILRLKPKVLKRFSEVHGIWYKDLIIYTSKGSPCD